MLIFPFLLPYLSFMNILILGATSDIAKAVSHHYAREKHQLLLAGRKWEELEKEAKDLEIRYGIHPSIHPFEATETHTHHSFYHNLPHKPDMVLLAFGHLGDQKELEKDWEQASHTLSVNFIGACSVLHHIANDFEERKEGRIVGISSVAGERGRASNYYYGSAKAGFTSFLSGLRNRLSDKGVHVLSVKPGFVSTRMITGMNPPPILTAETQEVAKRIAKAVEKKKNVIYVRGIWRWIMLIIRNIPEPIFKKMSL